MYFQPVIFCENKSFSVSVICHFSTRKKNLMHYLDKNKIPFWRSKCLSLTVYFIKWFEADRQNKKENEKRLKTLFQFFLHLFMLKIKYRFEKKTLGFEDQNIFLHASVSLVLLFKTIFQLKIDVLRDENGNIGNRF